MAKSLCELQAELKGAPLGWSSYNLGSTLESCQQPVAFSPKTPEERDLKRKGNSRKERNSKTYRSLEYVDGDLIANEIPRAKKACKRKMECDQLSTIMKDDFDDAKTLEFLGAVEVDMLHKHASEVCLGVCNTEQSNFSSTLLHCHGDFPIPKEIASVDANYLTKRCGLGYRGKRIWKLAKDICDGVLDPKLLEEQYISGQLKLEDLKLELLRLEGFGPYTCANVLMCMGEYRFLPADSETVRHLKQVHGRSKCTIATVSSEITEIYGHYGPFQFLAYWFELWGSYEKKFGQLSNMAPWDYGLITGHNMKR